VLSLAAMWSETVGLIQDKTGLRPKNRPWSWSWSCRSNMLWNTVLLRSSW